MSTSRLLTLARIAETLPACPTIHVSHDNSNGTISFNTDSIFVPVNIRNAEFDWEAILFYTTPDVAKQNMQYYDVHYVVVDKRIPLEFQSYGYDRPSGLLVLVADSDYKTYDSMRQSIWFAQLG